MDKNLNAAPVYTYGSFEKYSSESDSPYVVSDEYLKASIEGEVKYFPPYCNGITLPCEFAENIEKTGQDLLEIREALHALKTIKLQAENIFIHSSAIVVAKEITLIASSKIIIEHYQHPIKPNNIRTTVLAKQILNIDADELIVNDADIFEPQTYTIKVIYRTYNLTPTSKWLGKV
ncbi:MAG: hypothetical protein L0207_00815 [Chlamydiae bacterium]|nr:hypothetical protein [Chlamydiota bacterium]